MRVPILAAAAAITLGACQPAADPQPVEAQTAPGASATTPMEAAPVATPEPTPQPQAAAPAPAPSPLDAPTDPPRAGASTRPDAAAGRSDGRP